MMRARRAVAGLLVVIGLVIGVGAGPAEAHAVLVRSDPPSGAVLAVAPTQVRLWFSEELAERLSTARLIDADGSSVAGTRLVTAGEEVWLRLPHLSSGSYAVVWSVVADDDGHRTAGSVAFGVGGAAARVAGVAGSTDTAPAADAVVTRWARLLLTSTAIGGLAVALVVLGGAGAVAARRRLLLVALVGAVGGGVLTVLAPVLTGGPEALADSRGGRLAVVEAGLLLALAALAVAAIRGRAVRRTAVLAVVLAVGIALTEALRSHAASLPGWFAVVATTAHVLAALTWLGMLPALLVLLAPRDGRGDALRGSATGFARLAGAALVLLVASGLVGAGQELATPGDLLGTGYGRAVLVKAGLVAAVAAVALRNDVLLRRSRLAVRWVTVEAALGVAALAAAAVLGESVPAPAHAPAQAEADRPAPAVTSGGSAADLVVSVTASPGRPGLNVFSVEVTSSQRPAPAPVTSAVLGLGAGQRLGLRADGDLGHYVLTADVRRAALAPMQVLVRRAGRQIAVPLRWQAAAAAVEPEESDADSGHRLAAYTEPLALLALLSGAGAVAVLTTRRRKEQR